MALKDNKTSIFLIIAFIEGATVMAVELLGAKMTAPFFGTTIYSWAAVLAITLGGLASGYYLGGWTSTRKKPEILLLSVLLASGIFMIFMPMISVGIMKAVIEMNLITGLIISLMVFLFPVVLLFGMVGPIIISALVNSAENSGKIAGKVYAISTVGGVINTLILGFYIIPTYGIKGPAIAYGILIILTAFLLLVSKKKLIFATVLFLVSTIAIRIQTNDKDVRSPFKIRYSSEGLLGQVKVADYAIKTDDNKIIGVRGLLVNNTWQTVINKNDGTSMLDYIYFIRPLLSKFKKGSETLLIGLGGGTLCREIQHKGHNVEVVELDSRLAKLAKKYFGLSQGTVIHEDDGRHFLRTAKKKYDLIIFDAFLGENPPWHLLTLESFQEVKSLLKTDGKLIIEFYGFLKGENGYANRSLYKTIEEAGFKVDVIATGNEDNIERNFVYVAGVEAFDFNNLDYSGISYTDKDVSNLKNHLIAKEDFFKEKQVILTDDLPILEEMLMQPALEWRKELNVHFRDRFVALGQPIFY